MEIERKYLVHEIPVDLTKYQVKHMEQMYVSVKPVIRIRRTDDRRAHGQIQGTAQQAGIRDGSGRG